MWGFTKTFTSKSFEDIDGTSLLVMALSDYDPDAAEPAGEVLVGKPGTPGAFHSFHGIRDEVRLTSAEEVQNYLAWHRTAVEDAARAVGLFPPTPEGE